MNRERAKALLPIIQAFAEGKRVQFRLRTSPGEWCYPWGDLPDNEAVLMTFPADDYEYRVKPREPREWWVDPLSLRVAHSPFIDSRGGSVRLREVLDD